MPSIPWNDPSVGALDEPVRLAIAAHWRRRARSELEVGRAFAQMAPLLDARGASPIVVEGLVRAAREEERHSATCLRLASTYGGTSEAAPEVVSVVLPRFGVGDDDLELALLVAGMCCVNETVATAWLGAGLAVATAPIAIAANRFHLEDEIGHARLGWAHLTSIAERTREELAVWLPALLASNAPGWERDDPFLPEGGVEAHGHLSAGASRAVARDALRELVVPGFAHVGIDVDRARRWIEARLDT